MNTKKVERIILKLLRAMGQDPTREALIKTPARVAASYAALLEGYTKDPAHILTLFSNDGSREMIMVKNIEFFSLCEHHLLPFFGSVHIGYIPDTKIIGLSKLPRLVDIYARRLQNQERLTKQIADAILLHGKVKGVGVIIEAEHLCVRMRGVAKQHGTLVTQAFCGVFTRKATLLSLIS